MKGRSIDEATFESWVRDHGAAVYRAAHRVLRSSAAAEDAAQQVFLAALEGRVRTDGEHGIGGELRWWAVKTALFHLRTQRRRSAREEAFAMKRAERSEDAPLEAGEDRRVIAHLVDELPDDLRLPVMLRFEQGISFKRIGELCAVAEATAFERVQRGLERLKRELSRVGFAGLAPALPDLLARVPEGIAVPAALQAQLVALSTAPIAAVATGASVAWKPLLALGAALSCAGVLYFSGLLSSDKVEPTAPQDRARGARTQEDAAPVSVVRGSTPPSGEPARPAQQLDAGPQQARANPENTGRVSGRLVGADGIALAGAEIRLASVESAGKRARFEESARTDAAGAFALAVPVAQLPVQLYTWTASAAGHAPRRAPEPIAIRTHAEIELGEIRLLPPGDDVLGRAEIEVRVVDEQGAAVAGATVHLFRPESLAESAWHYRDLQTQRSDAAGVARFEQSNHGLRHVRVEAAAQGFAPREIALTSAAGRNESLVALKAGGRLEGRLVGPASIGSERLALTLERDGSWSGAWAEVDAEGRFAFTGLDEGEYTLAFRGGDAWSDFHVERVRAGMDPLALELKPQLETRSMGQHDAELHGIVVDAADSKELPSLDHDLELEPVGAGSRAEVLAREGLRLLTPFFGQTAQRERGEVEPTARFALDGRAPGRYVLIARRQGYAPAIVGPFELAEREIKTDVRVEMLRGARYRGVVRGAGGRAVPRAIVFVAPESEEARAEALGRDREVRESGGQGHLMFGPYAQTDAEGRFALERAMPEMCARIWVLHPHHRPSSWPLRDAVEGSAESGLELELREAR